MNSFQMVRGRLMAESVAVKSLASRYGTPLYVYSRSHIEGQYAALTRAMAPVKPLICYSVKVNTNAAVIGTLAELGAGADVVSGGELYRARRAGVPPSRIAFAGVGKTREEIEYALRAGLLFFTVESEPELDRIAECARRLGRKARIALRANPDVDPETHHYISTGKKENKFGLDLRRIERAYRRAAAHSSLEIAGLHMHIGSQILNPAPFAHALERVAGLCRRLRARYPTFRYLDIGGGLGIQYKPGQHPLDPARFAKVVLPFMKEWGLSVVLEPGRFLVGNAGILVTRVQYVKNGPSKKFVIVDAGMNDLIRPPLYQAHHEIVPVRATRGKIVGDVVGPICESADFLAQDRQLPSVREGDLLAVLSAGAYGFAMASNYNSRGRPAEVLVHGRRHALIRRRETREDLVRGEQRLPWR
ncbi:MAG: diaminopimelate decarboxylase [Verrucomicrobia bacterium]|nr:diaminopimelate decarboxylase [Verrucomicrobiota bacterium]